MGDEKKPFNNPFGALQGLRDQLPAGPTPEERKQRQAPPRAVLRLERKGRGGKEVTVIELELAVEQRPVWLSDLKGSLGCGGAVEGTSLVLQGDHRERAAKWLTKRGVAKVVIGN